MCTQPDVHAPTNFEIYFNFIRKWCIFSKWKQYIQNLQASEEDEDVKLHGWRNELCIPMTEGSSVKYEYLNLISEPMYSSKLEFRTHFQSNGQCTHFPTAAALSQTPLVFRQFWKWERPRWSDQQVSILLGCFSGERWGLWCRPLKHW